MSLERFDAHDKRVLILWLLAGLIGAGVAYRYFFQAFPEAAVQFKVPRADALEEARQFATSQGARLDGYQSSIVFDVDDDAKTYLEREVGLDQANQMMSTNVHVWYWRTRFFRPLQKEEFDVLVDPSGQITGYGRPLEEAVPAAHLDRAAAQSVAESFLRDTLHIDLSRYDSLEQEANSTELPNRRDWSFTWERHGFRAKDASYRLNVTLAGDHVDGYREYLKIPEAWTQDYERLRSSNNLLEFVALIPYGFLFGACLYVIFELGRRGWLDWRGGLMLGAFLCVLYFVMTMNQFPLERASYDTNSPYSSFILSKIGIAALTSIFSALVVVVAVVPGESLYRVTLPGKMRLGMGLKFAGIRTKEFFTAGVIGISLAAAHIGYITVFYIVSKKLGAWAPQDLSYTDVVSTTFPWLYPLTIGIYAATSEEFLFRLFSVPFLLRTTKSKALAVVLPAFAWGFLHSNYPQEPAYIRGIEVGLIGIVAGLVMLRWGIWATLFWHYTVDAFLISTSLMRSSGAYLRISGSVVGCAALIPIAYAGFAYFSHGGFEVDEGILNRAKPLAAPESEVAQTPPRETTAEIERESEVSGTAEVHRYSAMSGRTLAILGATAVLGIASIAWIKPVRIGDFVHFSIDSGEAATRADQVMRNNKFDPATYHRATMLTYTFNDYTNEYLERALGVAAVNRIYQDQVPSAFWTIRYFRDSQTQEFLVVLHPDGSFHSLHHTLDEAAPGDNLTKEAALELASSYLRNVKHIDDLSAWKVVETNTEKKPSRTDTTFVFEQLAPLNWEAGGQPGAHIRMQVTVQGSEVSSYREFIKIPESWLDAETRTTPLQMAKIFGRAGLASLALVTLLVAFFRSLKSREMAQIPWKPFSKWSGSVLGAAAITFASRVPQFLFSYTTSIPLATFYITEGISLFFIVALYGATSFLLLGFAWLFDSRAFGRDQLPGLVGMPSAYYKDAFLVAVLGTPVWIGVNRLPALLSHWPLVQHSLAASVPSGLDAVNPAIASISTSVWVSFFALGLIGILAGLIAVYLRMQAMRIGLIILAAILLTSNVATLGSFLRDTATHLVILAVVWLGVTRVVRFNLAGYALLVVTASIISGGVGLWEQPNPYFHANAYAVFICGLALLIGPVIMWRRGKQSHPVGIDTIGN